MKKINNSQLILVTLSPEVCRGEEGVDKTRRGLQQGQYGTLSCTTKTKTEIIPVLFPLSLR